MDPETNVAQLIEELIDLKLAWHFRDQHCSNLPDEEHKRHASQSVVDSNRINAIRQLLPRAIKDLFARGSAIG